MNNLLSWFSDNMLGISAIMVIAILVLIVLVSMLIIRINRLVTSHKSLMYGQGGKNLENMLEEYLSKIKTAEAKVNLLETLCRKLEEYALKSIQNMSLIRYNAFENMGSDLSFSAALLDMSGDGFVISSINNRDETRVYAKPVKGSKSNYHLSSEEVLAINKAMERSRP